MALDFLHSIHASLVVESHEQHFRCGLTWAEQGKRLTSLGLLSNALPDIAQDTVGLSCCWMHLWFMDNLLSTRTLKTFSAKLLSS